MANQSPRLLMTLPDYERAFHVIYSVIKNEGANMAQACLYFGFIGAAILRHHYKVQARAAVGFAVYKLDSSNDVLALADKDGSGNIIASSNGFHCWVVADQWIVDFSAPLFREMWRRAGLDKPIERKMLQRLLSATEGGLDNLLCPGDVTLREDPALTFHFQQKQRHFKVNTDFEDIAVQWFQRTPKKISPQIGIGDAKGNITQVKLSGPMLSGAW
jgi:hypothetical protein